MYHVLIVDDDFSFRRSLAIQLELEGFQVSEAGNADEAFNYLENMNIPSNYPNLIISDIRMPGMSGIDFGMKIQKQFAQISFLIMSAFIQQDSNLPFTFFKKPFKVQNLVDYINQLKVENHA